MIVLTVDDRDLRPNLILLCSASLCWERSGGPAQVCVGLTGFIHRCWICWCLVVETSNREYGETKKWKQSMEGEVTFFLFSSEGLNWNNICLTQFRILEQKKTQKTKNHRPGGLNSKYLFLKVWRLGSPRSRCQQIRYLGESPLLGLETAAFLLRWGSHEGERALISSSS